MPTSSLPAPTNSADPRGSESFWSGILPRSIRSEVRSRVIGAGRRMRRALSLCGGARGAAVRHGAACCAAARLEEGVKAHGGRIIAEASPRIATIGAISLPGASNASLLVQFDLAGFAVSAGSACSSGAMKNSAVLAAMGVSRVSPGVSCGSALGRRRPRLRSTFLAEWRRIAARDGARPHDLPRLSGDHAGCARSRGRDAALGRGEVRQPPLALPLGT